MKRVIVLFAAIAICSAVSLVSGQSGARSKAGAPAKNQCPFDIVGLWRSDATTEINPPTFFQFSREGSVTLMGHSPDALPQDFEMIDAVNYELVQQDVVPKEIRFNTPRGNDAFPAGISLMDIVEYNDDSFTTLNAASGQKIRWIREQTERHFLTFAARAGTLELGGPVAVIWNMMDGRDTTAEALGLQLIAGPDGKFTPVFGQIPSELYDQLLREGEQDNKRKKEEPVSKEETVLIRFELTAREFEKTHKVFEAWAKFVQDRTLPAGGAYVNAFDFIKKAADNIDSCGDKLKLQKLDASIADQIVAKHNPTQRPLEYVKLMRKKNNELHKLFPWGWRPILQLPGQ